jgi:hypothetical protein
MIPEGAPNARNHSPLGAHAGVVLCTAVVKGGGSLCRDVCAGRVETCTPPWRSTDRRTCLLNMQDCVGFTNMCRQIEPRRVMNFLNEVKHGEGGKELHRTP